MGYSFGDIRKSDVKTKENSELSHALLLKFDGTLSSKIEYRINAENKFGPDSVKMPSWTSAARAN